MRKKKQKLKKGYVLKKVTGFRKVAFDAQQGCKELEVSHIFEQLEGPPAKHFLESRAGGAPSDVPLTASQVFLIRDTTTMLLINDPALVADRPELSPEYGEDIVIDAWQATRKSVARPTEGQPPSSGVNRDTQAQTSNLGWLLR